jgi:hypothetical protein
VYRCHIGLLGGEYRSQKTGTKPVQVHALRKLLDSA